MSDNKSCSLQFMPHQKQVLKQTKRFNRCAHYLKMGLGKTFTGAEKLVSLAAEYNLLICQKSKIQDWIHHFEKYYPEIPITDFTKKGSVIQPGLLVINYELCWRRPVLKSLTGFTLMLDESSNIMHENTKQSKFITGLNFENLILLSGTPCGGRYELMLTQFHMLGWNISRELFIKQYCVTEKVKLPGGRIVNKLVDYKNIDRLKRKSKQYGCVWMETEEAISLPLVIDQTINVPTTPEYEQYIKDSIITITKDGHKPYSGSDHHAIDVSQHIELVGDTPLTKLLYARQLCAQYNPNKIQAFEDILESTDDRLIVFYNFLEELAALKRACKKHHRPISEVSGATKNLNAYERFKNSVTLVQYRAGAMGLNLQNSNRSVYFSPPLPWEQFEQSKARIHRIGQEKTCFYYYLTCAESVEEKIYQTLAERKNYDEALFEKDFE